MTQHIHILGVAGTFMAGVALLAQQQGYRVTGSDANIYPPMSTVLEQAGIECYNGYHAEDIPDSVDCVVIGNALSRGNAAVESVLSRGLYYQSGPQWLSEHVLRYKHVLAVAGTHGKTTTSSMLLSILQQAGLEPGYLIGGVPHGMQQTAYLSSSKYFVIEADEYDTAFFDKRSKFIHYQPSTLILNNLEYDHADIFPDLEAIKLQFQYLLRTVPATGTVIVNANDAHLETVKARGCWSSVVDFAADSGWQAKLLSNDGSDFEVSYKQQFMGRIQWASLGLHNVNNALAAIAAATDVGVSFEHCQRALQSFKGVKRRLELIADRQGIKVYDDFAHHPTAIKTTLSGLRHHVDNKRIIVLLQLGSNSMKQGVHMKALPEALNDADIIYLWEPNEISESIKQLQLQLADKLIVVSDTKAIVAEVQSLMQSGDHIVIMSNKGFNNIHQSFV